MWARSWASVRLPRSVRRTVPDPSLNTVVGHTPDAVEVGHRAVAVHADRHPPPPAADDLAGLAALLAAHDHGEVHLRELLADALDAVHLGLAVGALGGDHGQHRRGARAARTSSAPTRCAPGRPTAACPRCGRPCWTGNTLASKSSSTLLVASGAAKAGRRSPGWGPRTPAPLLGRFTVKNTTAITIRATIPTAQAYLLPGRGTSGLRRARVVGLGVDAVLVLEALGRRRLARLAEVAEAVVVVRHRAASAAGAAARAARRRRAPPRPARPAAGAGSGRAG